MGQIQVMSAALANQIAAGEVVERPASCVKELVENSLDAGATSIQVSLDEGGIAGIVVQDDGGGMDEADAMLSFSRHATSKLRHERDLQHITSLGFRGEALASIAAVAKVELQTRTRDKEHGVAVRVAGTDDVSEPRAMGMAPGTRIQVTDLFFNTPARLKYLRSVTTEQARCVEVVQRAALSRPDVSFRCDVSGHVVFQTPGNRRIVDVMAAIYGVGEAKQLIQVVAETADYRVQGLIGRPTQGRSSRAHGHLFVNGRPVRSIGLHQAVVEGYQGRLMINRHPIYALHVEMDPALVDVNIHPHKAEVRFSEERDLAQLVRDAVRESLEKVFLVPEVQFSKPRRVEDASEQTRLSLGRTAPAVENWPSRIYANESEPKRSASGGPRPRFEASYDRPQTSAIRPEDVARVFERAPVAAAATEQPVPSEETAHVQGYEEPDATLPGTDVRSFQLRPVGQALGMYIVADDGENLYIIDQHAAHERVLYEKFMKKLRAEDVGRIALLTPMPLHLTPSQHALLKSLEDQLYTWGLEFEAFGGTDVILRTVPDIWEGLEAAQLVELLLEDVSAAGRRPDIHQYVREQIVMRACKAAIKANYYLSVLEMEALCDALSNLDDPFHCPHGRPVFIQISNHQLEKEFRRLV